jgi:L-ascorbate metabolism protein UlaG (beta-lactamase superfamily)
MKITKYGHCCLLIDMHGVRFLTDPGSYSTTQNQVRDVDAIVISHEHGDHLHVESLKEILQHNSNAMVITNPSVGKILGEQGITYHSVADGESIDVKGIIVEGMGTKHAEIWKDMGQVENTGYFFDNTLFYPGDAFYKPHKSVDVLALPIAGPWMSMREAIQYAIDINPRTAFPVHDAVLSSATWVHTMLINILDKEGVKFVALEAGETKEL